MCVLSSFKVPSLQDFGSSVLLHSRHSILSQAVRTDPDRADFDTHNHNLTEKIPE
jgi:hypothetical protein